MTACFAMTTALAEAQTVPSPAPSHSPLPAPAASASPAPGASPAASPSPTPTPTPLYQFAGYIDASHTSVYGADQLKFTNGVPDRVFDTENSHLQPNAVDVSISHNSTGMLGGKIELLGGTDANVIQSYNFSPNQYFSIMQLYLSYTGGLFTTTVGKYATLAGAEVIQSPQNYNFTRSILFGYAIPFTHTGIRETYSPNSVLSLIAGVNNGWDEAYDPNAAKTIEAGISYTPNKVVSLTAQGYSGHEPLAFYPLTPANGDAGNRTLVDVVGNIHVSTPLTLTFNYDIGTQAGAPLLDSTGSYTGQGTAVWDGFAGYANYQFPTLPVQLAIRGETFYDANGFRTGYQQRWSEETFTAGVTPIGPLTLRAEYRTDSSTSPTFLQRDGSGRTSFHTIGLEALIKFQSP